MPCRPVRLAAITPHHAENVLATSIAAPRPDAEPAGSPCPMAGSTGGGASIHCAPPCPEHRRLPAESRVLNVEPVAGGLALSAVSARWNHSGALTTAGALYCWGSNTSGRLGDGTTTDRSVPTLIATGPFASTAWGRSHSSARSSIDNVSCRGINSSGQLGDGTVTNRLTPTPVLGGCRSRASPPAPTNPAA
jgi:hypothetical protein